MLSVKRKAVSGILVTLLLMIFLTQLFNIQPVKAESGLLENSWPMFQHDPQHTGRSSYAGPKESNVRWILDDLHEAIHGPAVTADGTVYLAASKLYAITPDGELNELYESGGINAPVVRDEMVYVVAGGLLAIDSDGDLKWKRVFAHIYHAVNPTLGDNRIYYVAGCVLPDGIIHPSLVALTFDGEVAWIYDTQDGETYETPDFDLAPNGYQCGYDPGPACSTSIGPDGTIYFGSAQTLFAIGPGGHEKWRKTFDVWEGYKIGTPVISSEGTIYISIAGSVYAINPDGQIIWSSAGAYHNRLSAALGPDGTLYIPDSRYLYAVDIQGNLKWKRSLSLGYRSSPVVDSENTVYIVDHHIVRAFDSLGNEKWRFSMDMAAHGARSLSIGPNNMLFVPVGSKLYAFGPSMPAPLETEITSGPSGTIDYNDVTFTWTGSDDVTPTSELVYSYYLGGYESEWSFWTPDIAKSYNDLPNGNYAFKVKARDQAGNTDPTPAEVFFTISITQPHIDSITPSSAAPGIEAKIKGINFKDIELMGQVIFGVMNPAEIISWSDKEIVVVIPPGNGIVDVTVSGPLGRSNSVEFTYEEPVIDFIYPLFGKTLTEVTIEGRHFGLSHGLLEWGYYVKFGCSNARKVSWTDTKIIVEAPSDLGTGENDREFLKWLLKLAAKGADIRIPPKFLDMITDLFLHCEIEMPPGEGRIQVPVIVNTPAGTSNAALFTYRVSTIIEAYLCSPGELRVYDFLGHITGLVNGEVKEEIPYSLCDGSSVIIVSPNDSYRYEVIGTDEGTYGLEVSFVDDGETILFTATDIPTEQGAIHQYTIDFDAISRGTEGVTLQIDSDGDDIFEQTITADSTLTRDEFMLQTATTIDFDPDTLNLESKGKWVTVYIELPEGYDVVDIDVSTVYLYECDNSILAEPHPTEIGDYDDDGIADLMVKFDRQILIDYLKEQGCGDGDITELTVTGEATGTRFEGFDTIQVISKGKR